MSRCIAFFLLAAAASLNAEVRFTFPALDGNTDAITIDRVLLNGSAPQAEPRVRQITAGVTEVVVEAGHAGEWSFAIADNSAYYGFGERFDRLNHAHSILKNASIDVATDKGSITYQPMPFYMSLRGYGLWLDTTSEATFDLNVSDATHILVRSFADRLRIVLFQGPRFAQILDRFTALIGRQQLPPYWAFAPWKARDYHQNSQDVLEDVERYRKLGLPASVILIDSPWATNYNTYEFNPKQFDDARGMIARLHDEGYKLILWHTSWINCDTAPPKEKGFSDKIRTGPAGNFAEAERHGYFIHRPDGSTYVARWWKGMGSLIDFTNPEAKKWWQRQLSKVIELGADGFKNDDAEGAFIGDVVFAGGQDQRLMRNQYAVDYNRAVAEALQERKGRDWVMFQRSGTVGSQMLPLFWTGDNDATFSEANGLPTVVNATLNAGLSGISLLVSDLGGYNKRARYKGDNVLFARWTQFSALSPGMEVMSQMNLGPWDYGDDVLRIFKEYSVLYMSLFPYRYAAAQESARSGLPMMRALVLMHQDDPDARDAGSEYYFGPDLLVAPVLSAVTQRSVYLPEGDWVDYWTGKRYPGHQTIAADAPLDRIPLFVRSGAILPKIPEDVMTLVPRADFKDTGVQALDDRRVYEIYPGAEKRGITDFEGRAVSHEGDSLQLSGSPARVTVRWRFARPSHVLVNGEAWSKITGTADGESVQFEHRGRTTVSWQ